MKRLSFVGVCLFLCAFFSCPTWAFADVSIKKTDMEEEKGIYKYVTDDLVQFFEEEVAGEQVITRMPQKKVERLAAHYGVSQQKLKFLVGIKFMLDKGGSQYTLKELSEKSDAQIVALTMTLYNSYWRKLSEGEKQRISEKFEKLNTKYKFY